MAFWLPPGMVAGADACREGIEAARVRVQGGAKVARALSETTPFPDLALQMIAVGEETGRLEGMLASAENRGNSEDRSQHAQPEDLPA